MKINFKIMLLGAALLNCPSAFANAAAPHLWWGHETLTVDLEKCVLKSQIALLQNGFTDVSVNNDYHFLYAVNGEMRAGVQCIAQATGSFVYVNVAGPDAGLVEKSRNSIVFSIK